MYCGMSSSSASSAPVYFAFPLPPGTSLSWIPPSSLYCCHRSVSRISAAARNLRIAASPCVRPALPASARAGAPLKSPETVAPAPTASPVPKKERRLVLCPGYLGACSMISSLSTRRPSQVIRGPSGARFLQRTTSSRMLVQTRLEGGRASVQIRAEDGGGASAPFDDRPQGRISWPASLTDRMSIKPDATTLRLAAFPATNLRADVVLVLFGSGLIAGSAQISLPLPFTPVPITGQTFAVLLVGASLGTVRGGASAALYVLLGPAGAPVYAGGAHGLAVGTGASGGYLLSYPFVSALTGFLAERGWDRRFSSAVGAMLTGNVVIYLFGLPWLAVVLGTG